LRLDHQPHERGVVGGLMKNFGLSIRSVEDVVALVGKYEARWAWHSDDDMPNVSIIDVGKRW